jgi:hypothetical protein
MMTSHPSDIERAMSHLVQLHPDIASLHAQIDALRDELVRAVAYHDELRHTAIPYLEAVYQQAIGPAHLAELHAQVEAQRAKRLVELAMQAVNRGKPAPALAQIAAQVFEELATWQRQVEDMAKGVQQATRALSDCMSAADTAELKRIYRDLVRRLHPDANPDQDDHIHDLWQRVQVAYRDADLAQLRVLAEVVVAPVPLPTTPDAIEGLRAQRERLQDAILTLNAAIAALEQRPPLSLRRELADPTWIAARIAELQAQEQSWHEAAVRWQAKLDELYPTPDPNWN